MINFTIKLIGKKILFLLSILVLSTGLKAQLSGPKAIPGDYATIAAFVNDLNIQGVGVGGVTATVADRRASAAQGLKPTVAQTKLVRLMTYVWARLGPDSFAGWNVTNGIVTT